MKYMKKLAAALLAAAMTMSLLTACSGGGGGGGGAGGGGTPIAPVDFYSTKTYKLGQDNKDKPVYAEYWVDGNKDLLFKSGYKDENSYAEIYTQNILNSIVVSNNGTSYSVTKKEQPGYSSLVAIAEEGGADIPEGKTVYYDSDAVMRATTGGSSDGGYIVSGIDQLKESDVVVSTGTYRGYYAEIFTFKADPKKSITYAYDENNELKATVGVDHDTTTAMLFNKYEYDSAMFKPEKLNIASYNAVDITDAYIIGWKKLMSGQK